MFSGLNKQATPGTGVFSTNATKPLGTGTLGANASTTAGKLATNSNSLTPVHTNKLTGNQQQTAKMEASPEYMSWSLNGKKTVKAALESFEKDLEEQVQQFQIQASQVARWDRSIFECLSLMQHLEQQILTAESAQKDLMTNAIKLRDEQKTFKKELNVTTKKNNSSDQRQRLYSLASKLGSQFRELDEQLGQIREDTDKARHSVASQEQLATDIDSIQQIANCQLDAMRWLDHQSADIEERLDALSKKFPTI